MDDPDTPASVFQLTSLSQLIYKNHLPVLILSSALAGVALTRLLPSLPRQSRPTESNLDDEFTYTPAGGSGPCRVKALYIYPIKSCRGISLSSSAVVSTGLQHDRQFTFAERHEGEWRFITQRQHPLLTQVSTAIVGEKLVVEFPGGWWGKRRFSVLLEHKEGCGEELLKVTVWSDSPEAWKIPVDLRTLREFLGVKGELALFRVCERRELFRCAPSKETLGWQPVTGFTDSVRLLFSPPGAMEK